MAHSYVLGCRERGGLTYGDSMTVEVMTIIHLFVVQVIVGTTHGDMKYNVNKQTNKLLMSHLQETEIIN